MELYNLYKNNYIEYADLIKSSEDKLIFKEGYFLIGTKKIKPPVTKNIFVEIEELKQQRLDLLLEYKDLYNKIIYGYDLKKQYDKIVTEVNEIDKRIKTLLEYFDLVNKVEEDPVVNLKKDLKRLTNKLKGASYFDKKDIKEYLKKTDLINKTVKTIVLVDFYIVEPHVVFNIGQKEPIKKEKEPVKEKEGLITKEANTIIKARIKKLLAEKFKFTTKEECSSMKRSQPYFMTKEQIVNTIDDTPEILQIMPHAYKALKKEEICDKLFFD